MRHLQWRMMEGHENHIYVCTLAWRFDCIHSIPFIHQDFEAGGAGTALPLPGPGRQAGETDRQLLVVWPQDGLTCLLEPCCCS